MTDRHNAIIQKWGHLGGITIRDGVITQWPEGQPVPDEAQIQQAIAEYVPEPTRATIEERVAALEARDAPR